MSALQIMSPPPSAKTDRDPIGTCRHCGKPAYKRSYFRLQADGTWKRVPGVKGVISRDRRGELVYVSAGGQRLQPFEFCYACYMQVYRTGGLFRTRPDFGRKLTESEASKVRKLALKGCSIQEIHDDLGEDLEVSYETIRRIVRGETY